jgi:TPP-dependent pyruvate/acetoin dehydrogenase alpha subunit
MKTMPETKQLTKEDLQSFEKEIADIFATGVIRAPIHLRSGREEKLIEIFKNVRHQDYVFGYWDSHELALLKGVPREELKQAIIDGKNLYQFLMKISYSFIVEFH